MQKNKIIYLYNIINIYMILYDNKSRFYTQTSSCCICKTDMCTNNEKKKEKLGNINNTKAQLDIS